MEAPLFLGFDCLGFRKARGPIHPYELWLRLPMRVDWAVHMPSISRVENESMFVARGLSDLRTYEGSREGLTGAPVQPGLRRTPLARPEKLDEGTYRRMQAQVPVLFNLDAVFLSSCNLL